MSRPKVLFIGDLDQDLVEYQQFALNYECIHYTITTQDQLIHDFKTKFNDIVAIYGAWLGFHLVGGFQGAILESSPRSLRLITVCSVGYDGFDLPAMAQRGITLAHTPSLGADYVADLVLYHALNSFRFFNVFQQDLLKTHNTISTRVNLQHSYLDATTGDIKKEPVISQQGGYAFGHRIGSRFPITSPNGHTVTIVGFGGIGTKIAMRLSSLGMQIQYVKRTRLSDEEEAKLPFGVTYFPTLIEAAPSSDLVVLAVPGTRETQNMFNTKVIDLLPPRARVINVGRGSIINDEDLLKALQDQRVVFAGLDVFNGEPEVPRELLSRMDVLCTPHIGSSTIETFNDTAIYCLNNIDNFLKGLEIKSRVN